MSVDKIKDKILSEAREQAGQIEAEIAGQVKQIQAQEAELVKTIQDQALEEGRRRAEDRLRKDIATAELELRKAVLTRKQELIEQVFEQAFERLAQMKGEKYRSFLADLLMKSVQSGEEEVIFSKEDAGSIGQPLLEEINRRLVKENKPGTLLLADEDREIQGGFILRRGKREVNCTLTALFAAIREELEPRVAEILFS
jgi:V/A-type H+-transporting ATPase subunit E